MRRVSALESFLFRPIFEDMKSIAAIFNLMSFQHVYRERHELADGLLKVIISLRSGYWHICELEDRQSSNYDHHPLF
jgi:hypothetical protein